MREADMADEEVLPPLPTWSHLAEARRRPSEYEVVSVGLHHHVRRPGCAWELDPELFLNRWYRRYRDGSPLRHPDWNAFRDPDGFVYRGYVRTQNEQETEVDGLLDQYSEGPHDSRLSPAWLAALARFYTPARYGRHALQMAAAYAGQMAPASTITNCFFFQAADEARLVQRIAYRTAELRARHPDLGFGAQERATWEQDPIWQGFRELFEKALVAWDWGESFVAFNLVAKLAFDEATLRQLAYAASQNGDELLHLLCHSHRADVTRSRRFTAALLGFVAENEENRPVIQGWLERWVPLGDRALRAYFRGLPGLEEEPAAIEARAACHDFRASLGFT
jgi:toluene monooxygenase system protein E